jgi:nucleoside-diphosphate kinase
MATERTLSIIKPGAVRDNHIGGIVAKFEAAGLRVVASKMIRMSEAQAGEFYGVHRDQPFFGELVEFMTYGPVVVQVLEGENAIQANRDVMGATNPANAAPGTIRAEFATSITENAVHGSDGPDTARSEISFFFKDSEIFSRS